MFDSTVRTLARVFVNGSHVQVKGSTFAQLLAIVGDEFIPRAVTELQATGPVQRLGAITPAGDWTVHISSESIDVTYMPAYGASGPSFEEFCNRATQYLGGVQNMLGQLASRIAVAHEGLDRKTPEELETLGDRLLQRAKPFDRELFEWDWRVASRIDRDFGMFKAEPTNTIAQLKRVEINPPAREPHDELFISVDVNTAPRRINPRFAVGDVADFLKRAVQWHADLEASLDLLVKGN